MDGEKKYPIDLNKYIVEDRPTEAGPISLLLYRIQGIKFKEIEQSIAENQLKREEIKDKKTADGFTGKLERHKKGFRIGFARSGKRKISFLTDNGVLPLRLTTIPYNIRLQFKEIGENEFELIVQGGNKTFIERHFLKTLRKIVRNHEAKLNRLNLSQRFIREGLKLHKDTVYYLNIPPEHLKRYLSPVNNKERIEVEESKGEIKGQQLLTQTTLLRKLKRNPEVRVSGYKAREESPFNTGQIKYALYATGEMRFFLSHNEIKKAGSPFNAGIKIMQDLRSLIKGEIGKQEWPSGYLPDTDLTFSLLETKIEERNFEKIGELLLDLKTLDLFHQLRGRRETIFHLFLNFIQKGSIRTVRTYGGLFLSLLTEEIVMEYKTAEDRISQIHLDKILELCEGGSLLFPRMKSIIVKNKEKILHHPSSSNKMKGFTITQLKQLSEKNLNIEKIINEKQRIQESLEQKWENVLALRNKYISKQRRSKVLTDFAFDFFSQFVDVRNVSKKNGTRLLLQGQNSFHTHLVECKTVGEEITGETITNLAKEIKEKNEKFVKGILFTLSEIPKTVENTRRELLRRDRVLIYIIGKDVIETQLDKGMFSLVSLQVFEKKEKTQEVL